MESTEHLVGMATRIALEAHSGQEDKAHRPYWTHPERVVANVRRLYPEAPDAAVAAAWLHDVIEDTGDPDDILNTGWTADRLRAEGMSESVVQAVLAVTRLKGAQAPAGYDYYDGILAASDLALMVKHADITDNLDEDRLARLEDAKAAELRVKYADALERLGLD
jgi:(p)ppGpp synthase/HD superfamily hydrolase